jgi:ATP-dependent Lhr-like helicase
MSRRADKALSALRVEASDRVWDSGTVVEHRNDELWWWSFAGGRGNATLAAALDKVADAENRPDNHRLRLRIDVPARDLRAALDEVIDGDLPAPAVIDEAVSELKFGEVLPPDLAVRTLALRLSDESAARHIGKQALRWTNAQQVPS